MRIQKITLKNGMEVFINHDAKDKCSDCKKEIIWAYIPIELVSLAQWDLHKCVKDGNNKRIKEKN